MLSDTNIVLSCDVAGVMLRPHAMLVKRRHSRPPMPPWMCEFNICIHLYYIYKNLSSIGLYHAPAVLSSLGALFP